VINQDSGLFGTPFSGQVVSAARSASPSASSAPATSPAGAERSATSRPYEARATASTARRASSIAALLLPDRRVELVVHGSHLERAGRRRGAPRRPLERRVQRGELEDHEAAELLLGLRERTVLHAPLAVAHPHRGARHHVLERRAVDVGAGGEQRAVVGA